MLSCRPSVWSTTIPSTVSALIPSDEPRLKRCREIYVARQNPNREPLPAARAAFDFADEHVLIGRHRLHMAHRQCIGLLDLAAAINRARVKLYREIGRVEAGHFDE